MVNEEVMQSPIVPICQTKLDSVINLAFLLEKKITFFFFAKDQGKRTESKYTQLGPRTELTITVTKFSITALIY